MMMKRDSTHQDVGVAVALAAGTLTRMENGMFEVNTWDRSYLGNAASAALKATAHMVKYASTYVLSGAMVRGSFCVLIVVRTESTGTQRLFSVELNSDGSVKRCASRGTWYRSCGCSRKNTPKFVSQLLALEKSTRERAQSAERVNVSKLQLVRLQLRAERAERALEVTQARIDAMQKREREAQSDERERMRAQLAQRAEREARELSARSERKVLAIDAEKHASELAHAKYEREARQRSELRQELEREVLSAVRAGNVERERELDAQLDALDFDTDVALGNIAPKRYSVDFCGSSAPEVNDDCYWGEDFVTRTEALRAFFSVVPSSNFCASYTVAHIFLTENGTVIRERANPDFDSARCAREDAQELANDKRERATQNGMALGCAGFNDAMGY